MAGDNNSCRKTIRFSDTDASGRAHFSQLLCLVEESEHELLKSAGVKVFDESVGWPRVRLEIDFHSSVKFGDDISVQLEPRRIGNSSVTWGVMMTHGGIPVLSGSYVTVCVDGRGVKQPIPGDVRLALERLAGE